MATISHYTPQQVLEAGRRAEADGNIDYAVQFYAHVVSHYRASAEAIEASAALLRLDPRKLDVRPPFAAPQDAQHPRTPPALGGAPFGEPVNQRAQRPHPASGHLLEPTMRSGDRRDLDAAVTAPPTRRGARSAPRARAAAVAPFRRRYRLGRAMAFVVGWVGIFGFFAAAAGLGAGLVSPPARPFGVLLSLLPTSTSAALGLMFLACGLVLLSQMARATFDIAARVSVAKDDESDV